MDNHNPSPPASAAAIIDTQAQRFVAGLFSQRTEAITAIANLKFHGFEDSNVDLFVADDLQQEQPPACAEYAQTLSLAQALNRLGIPQDVASYYETDVRLGMALVVVIAGERSQEALDVMRGHTEEATSELSSVDQPLQDMIEPPIMGTMHAAEVEHMIENPDYQANTDDTVRKIAR
jgi:hypothetical protein